MTPLEKAYSASRVNDEREVVQLPTGVFNDLGDYVRGLETAISEERSRAERAESIADMSAIELIRSCTVSLAGTDYRDPMGEDLEPELAYAVARGLVELDAKGWLRFTEYAWQRCSEEAPK
jgi:hypothetical protein